MATLYDEIGKKYDGTRCADLKITNTIVDLLDLPKGASVVDIACGTGNYTIALDSLGYNMVGVDPSKIMLNSARKKNKMVKWVFASAEKIPLKSNMFDGAICTLACHHFIDLKQAFLEIYRIIDHGRFVLFTCTHKQIRNYWLYKYFPEVLETMTSYMPDIDVVMDLLCDAGFVITSVVPYHIDEDLRDNFLGARIEEPVLYLDENFRQGMSVFAKKAAEHHIRAGCQKLESDIQKGQYDEKYINPYGDYIFITVEKRKNSCA